MGSPATSQQWRGVITWRPTPRPGSPGNSNSGEPASVALRGREERRRLDGGRQGGSLSSSRAALSQPSHPTDQDDADGVEIGPRPTACGPVPSWIRPQRVVGSRHTEMDDRPGASSTCPRRSECSCLTSIPSAPGKAAPWSTVTALLSDPSTPSTSTIGPVSRSGPWSTPGCSAPARPSCPSPRPPRSTRTFRSHSTSGLSRTPQGWTWTSTCRRPRSGSCGATTASTTTPQAAVLPGMTSRPAVAEPGRMLPGRRRTTR